MATYRAPTSGAYMASLLMTPEEIDEIVGRSHESMQAECRRLITAQDAARRLLLGVDPYAEAWRQEPADSDGGSLDVMANAIAAACMHVGKVDMNAFPKAVVHSYLLRIATEDAEHPLVKHREVLRLACQDFGGPALDWDDITALVP